jgi:hypothetical protein
MDKMIAKYLDTKKQDFLKKKVKVNSTEKEIIAFNKEADDKFLMHNWLIDASNRAGSVFCSKFCKIVKLLSSSKCKNLFTSKLAALPTTIYFPVGDDYHLLSLLTPSAIVYKLKQRINENFQPFSERNKQEKEKVERAVKDKKELKGDLNSIWNLTAIGYGGTKPQNISVLNNQNGGIAYLLSSMPPILQKRKKMGLIKTISDNHRPLENKFV